MDFTREPIIETIITPREGHKLAIRNSKGGGQEEHFVDAVEIVSFGHALFFRSIERPKAFLVPVSDYEVLEVREARVVLKNIGVDRSIKIGGGRESSLKTPKESEKTELSEEAEEKGKEEGMASAEVSTEVKPEVRVDKKRDRRRHYRKRKGKEEDVREEGEPVLGPKEGEKEGHPLEAEQEKAESVAAPTTPGVLLSSLLQPPPLISETISRYRQNELFKGAFYLTEEEQYKPHDKVQDLLHDDEEESGTHLKEPIFSEEGSKEAVSPPSAEEKQEEKPQESEKESSSFWEEGMETFSSLYEEEERAKEHSQDSMNEPENHH